MLADTSTRCSPSAQHSGGGLTSREAAAQLARVGPNELPPPKRPSLVRRVATELGQPLVLLLLVAAGVSGLVLREALDAAAIAAIVVLNATIGLVEEGRASRALDTLKELEAPRARAVRDGRTRDLPAREIVPDDLVLIAAGDRVPADGRLTSADGLQIDEAVLTGESLPVDKHAARAPGEVFAGTVVTRGRGSFAVTATGPRTVLGRIAGSLDERAPTPLQEELVGVARTLGAAAVVVAAGVLVLLLLRLGDTVTASDAFLTTVALAVAAVPEGLATVTAVALAIGVRHMADHGAIVRRLPAVETLGSTTVLVFDKTGTLTENRLRVDGLLRPTGEAMEFRDAPGEIVDAIELVAALCSDTEPGESGGDPVERALMEAVGLDRAATLRADWPRRDTVPFTSEQGWMGTGHRNADGESLVVCKGAPEVVVPRCPWTFGAGGGLVPVDATTRTQLRTATERCAAEGAKVLALAIARGRAEVTAAWADQSLVLVGLVALRDPLRTAGSDSVARMRRAGIHLVMATGDHPGTAASVADAVDLDGSAQPATVRTGPQIAEGGWPDDPAEVTAYARVTPDQKLDLIRRLKDRGEVVAMTGDGVNDAPALQAADIGVALGQAGTEVAREASDLVLTNDDLATMVEAVRRGRVIYAAIRRVVDYLVAGNLSEILLVVGVLLLRPDLGVPLLPLHLLWINLLTDGAPAVALGVDLLDDGVLDRPPRSRQERLLDRTRLRLLLGRGAVLASGALLAATVGADVLDLDAAQTRTFALTVLVFAHLLYALVLARVRARSWVPAAVLCGLALHVLAVLLPGGRALLDLGALPALAWPAALVLGCLPVALIEVLQRRRRDLRPARPETFAPTSRGEIVAR